MSLNDISWPCVLLSVRLLSFCKTLLIVMLIIFTVCSQDGWMSMRCLSWKMRSIYACFTCTLISTTFSRGIGFIAHPECRAVVTQWGPTLLSRHGVQIRDCNNDVHKINDWLIPQKVCRMLSEGLGVGIWRPLLASNRDCCIVIYTSNPV